MWEKDPEANQRRCVTLVIVMRGVPAIFREILPGQVALFWLLHLVSHLD